MGSVIGEIVPLALAIALSPFPIIPAILLLFTSRARAAGLAFLGGWAAGIAVATGVFVLLAAVVEMWDEPPTWVSWVRVVVGVPLVVLGVKQWLSRGADKDSPAWMRSIDGLSPLGALRLGVLLSAANPKILLLCLAGGLAIGSAEVGAANAAAALVVFTVIAAATVALPVLSYVVAGDRILGPLSHVRQWLQRHNAVVMSVVITVFGLVLVAKGVSGITHGT
ncbi:MAG: GAP family protein [Actinomycetes bacterium]